MKKIMFTKKIMFALILSMLCLLMGCNSTEKAQESKVNSDIPVSGVKVEIFYLNHPPVLRVLEGVEEVINKYEDVTVIKYDSDTNEGQEFAASKNLTDHIPIVIYINNSMEYQVNDKKVTFYSFPEDAGGSFPVSGGDWNISDLDAVLQEVTND